MAQSKSKNKNSKSKNKSTNKNNKNNSKSKIKSLKKPKKKQPLLKLKPKMAQANKSATTKVAKTKKVAQVLKSPVPSKKQAWEQFITPLDDRVAVEIPLSSLETRTAGGLFIPASAESDLKPQTGTVIAVGQGHRNKKGMLRPMDVQVGDRVLFPPHVGTSVHLQNHEILLLRESDLLGVL